MKPNELREKKTEELQSLEDDLRRQLSGLELKIKMGTSEQTAQRRQLRREIARVLTIQREKSR